MTDDIRVDSSFFDEMDGDTGVFFNIEDLDFNLSNQGNVEKWLYHFVTEEDFTIKKIDYIFCSDQYLHSINVEHLNHDTFTDIITFDLSTSNTSIESDIFISIDRVKENAYNLKVSFQDELLRVLAHGVLHLMGYKDKSSEDIVLMRQKEQYCIDLYHRLFPS